MHELGILVHIVKVVQQTAEENHIDKVKRISLEVGEVCGAIPEYLEKQFPLAILDNPMFEDCQLNVECVTAMGRCLKCGHMYRLKKYKGICPHCGYDDFVTVKGTELRIKNIEVLAEAPE